MYECMYVCMYYCMCVCIIVYVFMAVVCYWGQLCGREGGARSL